MQNPEGVKNERDNPSSLSYGWLLFLLALIGLATLWPLRNVWIVVNDDIKFSSAVLAGGLSQFCSTMWALTLRYGRMHFFKVFTYYLPFAVDSFIYFKAVTMAALVGSLLLFSYFLQLLSGSKKVFYLALLLSLVGLQISWEHNAIVSFAGQHTISFVYLLLSFIAYIHYLRKQKKYWLWISVIAYASVLFPYEMFLIYAPVYFLLGLWEKRGWQDSLRRMVPHLACIAIFFIAFFAFQHFRSATYEGAEVGREFHLNNILRVIEQFSISSLPGYFYFSTKYKYIIRTAQDLPARALWSGSLQAIWILKALLVAAVFWALMRRKEAGRFKTTPTYGFLLLIGVAYFFGPSFLLALTQHYQESVITGGQEGMQTTYYAYFGYLFVVVLLLSALSMLDFRAKWRRIMLTGLTGLLCFLSLAVDFTNYYICDEQAKTHDRWKLIDQFLKSPAYADIPKGSVIYAPSLFRPVATLTFAGQAIDPPPPGKTSLYANYWNFYFNYRGNKSVTVLDPSAPIPDTPTGFYYLKYITEPNSRSQSLVFCRILPDLSLYPSGSILCDRAILYDLSHRHSLIVGGLVESPDAPSTVTIQNGDSFETNGIFLLEAGERNYTYRGDLKELVITADKNSIQADSVLVTSGQIPPLAVDRRSELTKLKGWYRDEWIGPEATARIRAKSSKKLIIAGYFPGDIFKTLGWKDLGVAINLNGAPVESLSIAPGKEFRIERTLSADTTYILSIDCNRFFVPSEMEQTQDSRKLGVLITEIRIE